MLLAVLHMAEVEAIMDKIVYSAVPPEFRQKPPEPKCVACGHSEMHHRIMGGCYIGGEPCDENCMGFAAD